jgi:hypothetical protein
VEAFPDSPTDHSTERSTDHSTDIPESPSAGVFGDVRLFRALGCLAGDDLADLADLADLPSPRPSRSAFRGGFAKRADHGARPQRGEDANTAKNVESADDGDAESGEGALPFAATRTSAFAQSASSPADRRVDKGVKGDAQRDADLPNLVDVSGEASKGPLRRGLPEQAVAMNRVVNRPLGIEWCFACAGSTRLSPLL